MGSLCVDMQHVDFTKNSSPKMCSICCLQVPCFKTCASLLFVLGEGQWEEAGKDGS